MNKKTRGFTLIELLVVIAIIGILSSVVLASLNTARAKGNNARIKAQLSGARAAAEIYFDGAGSYGTATVTCNNMFADTPSNMATYATSSNYPGTPAITCVSTGAGYAMAIPLSTAEGANTYWCIDSSGQSKGTAGVTVGSPASDVTC